MKKRANSLIVLVETLTDCSSKPTVLFTFKPQAMKNHGRVLSVINRNSSVFSHCFFTLECFCQGIRLIVAPRKFDVLKKILA